MFCLAVPTDPAWALHARAHLDAVLLDHAHCEMKAAANALSLAARPPSSYAVAQALADLAREETEHFQRVLALLEKRGVRLRAPPVDAYASDLLAGARALRTGPALGTVVERLLVGAVIEARSCERFKLLLEVLDPVVETDVHALYMDLFPAEARHYRTFVDLAVEESGGQGEAVRARLGAIAAVEARIVERLAVALDRATVHG